MRNYNSLFRLISARRSHAWYGMCEDHYRILREAMDRAAVAAHYRDADYGHELLLDNLVSLGRRDADRLEHYAVETYAEELLKCLESI